MSHRSGAAGAASGGARQCVRCLYLIFVLWSILCVSSQVEATTKKSKFKKSHHKTTHPTPAPSPSPRPSPAPHSSPAPHHSPSPSPTPPGNSHQTVFDIRKTGAVCNGVQDDTQVIRFFSTCASSNTTFCSTWTSKSTCEIRKYSILALISSLKSIEALYFLHNVTQRSLLVPWALGI